MRLMVHHSTYSIAIPDIPSLQCSHAHMLCTAVSSSFNHALPVIWSLVGFHTALTCDCTDTDNMLLSIFMLSHTVITALKPISAGNHDTAL